MHKIVFKPLTDTRPGKSFGIDKDGKLYLLADGKSVSYCTGGFIDEDNFNVTYGISATSFMDYDNIVGSRIK